MRFYTSYENRRGNTYGAGMRAGGETHTRGWNAGVKVTVNGATDSSDWFEVYMTGGRSGSADKVLLGRVRDTREGPVFEPSAVVTAKILADNGVGAA